MATMASVKLQAADSRQPGMPCNIMPSPWLLKELLAETLEENGCSVCDLQHLLGRRRRRQARRQGWQCAAGRRKERLTSPCLHLRQEEEEAGRLMTLVKRMLVKRPACGLEGRRNRQWPVAGIM